jgi:hypothetical protein
LEIFPVIHPLLSKLPSVLDETTLQRHKPQQ